MGFCRLVRVSNGLIHACSCKGVASLISARLSGRLGLVAMLLVLAARAAWAQGDVPESDLPVLGIAAGQIFRFSVASVNDSNRAEETRQGCEATLSFLDTQNRPVGSRLQVSLGPNEAGFLDLDTRTLGLSARQRINVRPVLMPSAQSGPCFTSFSILNALTRRLLTHDSLALPTVGVTVPFSCPSGFCCSALLPPLGWGQTLLLTVVRFTSPVDVDNMPLPCDVIIEIREGGPATPAVASLTTGPLMPGQSATLSLNGNTVVNFGETALLSQNVISTPVEIMITEELSCTVTTADGCILSYQVIDNLSAWTTVISLPP